MPILAEKTREEQPLRTSRGWATTEEWEVQDVNADGSVNMNGYVNPQTVLNTPGLPQYGQAHAVLPGALVVNAVVSKIIANWSVLVRVTYRGWGLYTGGPRSGVGAIASRRYQSIPIWRKFVVDGITGWEEDKDAEFPRMTIVREEERSIGGNVVNAVIKAVAQNAGRLFNIDGDLYILSDHTRIRFDGLAYTRAVFCFEIPCEFQGIGVNDPEYGNDRAVPYLPPLYQYVSYADLASSANPPVIKVVPPPAVFGNLAPFFP